MAVGQAVLRGVLDVSGVRAAEDRLARRGVDAGRVHAATLRDVLTLHDRHAMAGMPLSTVPQIALLLRCSEWRADRLLGDALGLAELPESFSALEWGLLTVEQSSVVVAQLSPLEPPLRLAVWQRLLARLRADVQEGVVRPPARLTELLKRWGIEADRAAAEERRRQVEADRRVSYRRRDDGLVDLFLIGVRAPQAQAVLQRIAAGSAPLGSSDERTADQRRLDAAVDLLLGRDPIGERSAAASDDRPGSPLSGADVQVLVPLGGALGTTDEVAELVGHGPIESDLLQELLLDGPRLRPVFVDADGVPVALGNQRLRPEPGDPAALRGALQQLARARPDRRFPRHPADHPPEGPPEGGSGGPEKPEKTGHPHARPGPYKVGGSLRRLLSVRAPRCEFPACGAAASRCDAEHDGAWPDGPTCACNLGPCCRRHHRVKQEGWTKTRRERSTVDWTSPTGRTWISPSQHEPPALPVRPAPVVDVSLDPFDELSESELEHELWWLAGCPDDPAGLELRATDIDPEDGPGAGDVVGQRLVDGSTRWSLDLEDPYAWLPAPAGATLL